jgi:predicted GIY-YIG superfamily endonuclease
MFYVYLLRSTKTGKLYIGFTANLKKRFAEHKLVYYESYLDENNAKTREKNLKYFAKAYS